MIFIKVNWGIKVYIDSRFHRNDRENIDSYFHGNDKEFLFVLLILIK